MHSLREWGLNSVSSELLNLTSAIMPTRFNRCIVGNPRSGPISLWIAGTVDVQLPHQVRLETEMSY